MGIPSRKKILYAAVALLIAAAGLVLFLRHEGHRRLAVAMARFELDVADLDPAAHAPADLPDGENAAYWLQQGWTSWEVVGKKSDPDGWICPLMSCPAGDCQGQMAWTAADVGAKRSG